MLEWWLIGLLGAVGGLVNSLLINQNRVLIPQRDGRQIDLGFISNLVIGALAAVVAISLGGGAAQDRTHQVGLALLSGLAGGNFLSSFLQRFAGELAESKQQSLQKLLQQVIGGVPSTNLESRVEGEPKPHPDIKAAERGPTEPPPAEE